MKIVKRGEEIYRMAQWERQNKVAVDSRFVVITATADEDELDFTSYLWR